MLPHHGYNIPQCSYKVKGKIEKILKKSGKNPDFLCGGRCAERCGNAAEKCGALHFRSASDAERGENY